MSDKLNNNISPGVVRGFINTAIQHLKTPQKPKAEVPDPACPYGVPMETLGADGWVHMEEFHHGK